MGLPMAAAVTCGDVKTFYKGESCCGSPDKIVSATPPGCPYNFKKPACDDAEVQAPRDLSDGATGEMTPKAATLNDLQAGFLPLVNVHFHLGAEHKSNNYNDGSDSDAYDSQGGSRRLGGNVRPGWMCPVAGLTDDQLQPYDFRWCKGEIQVGKSYEVHYVHSSAGYAPEDIVDADHDLDDGLGGAANGRGLLNPMVVVQAQVYQIVNGAPEIDDLLHAWTVVGHDEAVMYPGSTAGPSHDNSVCSPYTITWHVDKACHQVPPRSFDKLCKQMKGKYDMEQDLYPHGSRVLVDKNYVAKSEYVKPLA